VTADLQKPCPQCGKPTILAMSTKTAAHVVLDAVPSADGAYGLSTEYEGLPRARPVTPKLAFGRTNLYSDHAKTCGTRAGAKSKSTRRQGA